MRRLTLALAALLEVGGVLALRPVENDGARRSAQAFPARGDAVHEAHGQRLAVGLGQIEVDDRVARRAGIGLDRADQRHSVARDDIR